MKKCPYCGASIYFDNTAYCPECGKPLNTAGEEKEKKVEEKKRPQSVPIGVVTAGLNPASSAPKPYKPNMPAPVEVHPIEAFVLKGSRSSLFANAFSQTGMPVPAGGGPSPKPQQSKNVNTSERTGTSNRSDISNMPNNSLNKQKTTNSPKQQSTSRFFSAEKTPVSAPEENTVKVPNRTESARQPKKVSTSGFFSTTQSQPEKTEKPKKMENTVRPVAEPQKSQQVREEKKEKTVTAAKPKTRKSDAFSDILAADKERADEKKRFEDEFQNSEPVEETEEPAKDEKEDESIRYSDFEDSYDDSDEYDDTDDDDDEYDDDDDEYDDEDDEDYDDAYDAKEAKRRQRQLDKAIRAKEGFDPNRHIGLFFLLTVLCPLLMPILILLSLKRPRRIRYVLTGFILGLFVWFTVGLVLFANPPLLTKTDAMLAQHLPESVHNIIRSIYNAVPYPRIKSFFTGVSRRGL